MRGETSSLFSPFPLRRCDPTAPHPIGQLSVFPSAFSFFGGRGGGDRGTPKREWKSSAGAELRGVGLRPTVRCVLLFFQPYKADTNALNFKFWIYPYLITNC